jgi:hypothetical protein
MAAHSTQDATTSIGSNCWTLRVGHTCDRCPARPTNCSCTVSERPVWSAAIEDRPSDVGGGGETPT